MELTAKEQLALKTLTKQEQQVITLRFGLKGEPKELKELAVLFNLSWERVRQIEHGALAKLPRSLERKLLGSKSHKCLRCNWEWKGRGLRGAEPRQCPHCQSTLWDLENGK